MRCVIFIWIVVCLILFGCKRYKALNARFILGPIEGAEFIPFGAWNIASGNGDVMMSLGIEKEKERTSIFVAYDTLLNKIIEKKSIFDKRDTTIYPLCIDSFQILIERRIGNSMLVDTALLSTIDYSIKALGEDHLNSQCLYGNVFSCYYVKNDTYTNKMLSIGSYRIGVNEQQKLQAVKGSYLAWTDSVIYDKSKLILCYLRDIRYPYFFLVNDEEFICMSYLTGEIIWKIALRFGVGVGLTINYDSVKDVIYISDGYIVGVQGATGAVLFDIKELYGNVVQDLVTQKIFTEDYIFGCNSNEIGIYRSKDGVFVNKISIPFEEGVGFQFKDIMVCGNNLLVVTSKPVGIVVIPIDELIDIKEVFFLNGEIVAR